MTLDEWLKKVNYEFRGTEDDAPTAGDEDAQFWVSEFNTLKNNLYDDTNQKWQTAFVPDHAVDGTIEIATRPSFILPDNFIMPSDQLEIDANGHTFYIDYVAPENRNRHQRQFYIAGDNPKKLYLSFAIPDGHQLVGGSLILPGYYRPADVDYTIATAVIPVPDPQWSVIATAAQVAFNDTTYDEKYPDLLQRANSLYVKMAAKNRRGTAGNARKVRTNVPKIGLRV
jgi:hypothetical protein